MGPLQVWKRLLWKEFRESRLMLALALLLPPIVFTARFTHARWAEDIAQFSILAIVILVALYGARQGNARSGDNRFAKTHLPVRATDRWLAAFIIPLIVVGLAGAWLGAWASINAPWTHTPTALTFALVWGIFLIACYTGSYLISEVFTPWPAVLCTIAWTITAMSELLPKGDQKWQQFLHSSRLATELNIAIIFCAFVGTVLFDILMHKRPILVRRSVSLGVALLVSGGLIAGVAAMQPKEATKAVSGSDDTDVVTSTTGKGVLLARTKAGVSSVKFRDVPTGLSVSRKFPFPTRAIGLVGTTAYLLQQAKGDPNVRIVVWDTTKNDLKQIASVRTGVDATTQGGLGWDFISTVMVSFSKIGFVSPSGYRAILAPRSKAGAGLDLWLVDLSSGHSRLIGANRVFNNMDAVWTRNHVFLFGYGDQIADVDTDTGKLTIIRLPRRLK